MNLQKHKNDWLFIPLGGSGEIGMNLNAYHYQGKWLLVDFGAGFADDYLPGVDMIVPDIQFLIQHSKDILGLVLTHAHEDHLGAVQYLWPELQCPIYTTAFTAAFLKSKIHELPFAKDVKIHVVDCGSTLKLDPFTIEMVPLTHSTIEMHALAIRTDQGVVFHTGDWKFDHDPVIGQSADEERLAEYGNEGVLAMIGDSTNVFNPGTSGSEGDLSKSLCELIAAQKQMVVVTTFASNVARIETLLHAAAKAGRKVVLAGRSLFRIVEAAKASGYLLDAPPIYDDSILGHTPRNQLMIICTGCQGETLAAATKIANFRHPKIRMATGDTIIFSSKIIPGNEKKIYHLFNLFTEQGVEVMTEKDHFVHVSGHPAREELARMYALIKPKVAIPVHGELVHIHAHAAFAKECGVPQALQVKNGSVVLLSQEKTDIIDTVPAGHLAVDGYYLLPPESYVLQGRRRLQNDGALIVTIICNQQGDLRADPVIFAPGCLDMMEDKGLVHALIEEIETIVSQFSTRSPADRETMVTKAVKSMLKRTIQTEVGKFPLIDVRVVRC